MLHLENCQLRPGFSRGRYFKRLGAKARFAYSRGPGSFCFSWRSRHVRVSHSFLQTKRIDSQLEASA